MYWKWSQLIQILFCFFTLLKRQLSIKIYWPGWNYWNIDKWGNLNQILINYIFKKSYRVRGGRVWLNFPNPSVGGCGIDTDEAIMSRPPGPLIHWTSPLFSTNRRLCPPNNDFRALSTHDKFFWAPTRLGMHNLELGKNIDCTESPQPKCFSQFFYLWVVQ